MGIKPSEDVHMVHKLINTEEYLQIKMIISKLVVFRCDPLKQKLLRRRLIIHLFVDEI